MKSRRMRQSQALARTNPDGFLLAAEKQPWAERLRRLLNLIARRFKGEPGVHHANHDTVRRALLGMGPDNAYRHHDAGARMAVNLSSANVPEFCRHGYKNTYDLQASLGAAAPRISERRERVDMALPIELCKRRDVYFGAVELGGAGMRYYGDICLVLKAEAVAASTVVLDRNSFDVDRAPAVDRIRALPQAQQDGARAALLRSWSGVWARDLAAMTTIRMHSAGATGTRRWTTGHVGRALVDDEDYLEVLKHGSFGVDDIQEARLFAADAALDAYVTSRVLNGPMPRLEALIWRRRRVAAEVALRAAGIPVRVVTHLGRERH
jgi:hypothetical protein